MMERLMTRAQAAKHRYNKWGGNPQGTPWNPSRCAESVCGNNRGDLPHQCVNKSGKGPDGLYCGTHDPEAVARRKAKMQARWDLEKLEGRTRHDLDGARDAVVEAAKKWGENPGKWESRLYAALDNLLKAEQAREKYKALAAKK